MRQLRVSDAPEGITKLRELIEAGGLPGVYLMIDGLVRVERSPVPLRAGDVTLPERAVTLTPALIQRLIAEHVDAQRLNSRAEWKPFVPSAATILAATAGCDWTSVPVLRGVTGVPVFRGDWTLPQASGYDEATGHYLSPAVQVGTIPDRPEPGQVAAARGFLVGELLGDFPWSGKADLPNYLGVLLTPFVRLALKAPTSPLAVVTASMPGSGKTNLTSILGALIGQQTVSWPAGVGGDVELEKLVTSTFTASGAAVVFDNIDNGETIDSAVLARLLTAAVWSGRILGSTGMASFPNDREWLVTGNNLRLGGDLPPRSVMIRLEPDCERPEERTDFRIPNLETWITHPQNRAKVLRAVLILVSDWVAAGAKPDRSIPPMRSWTSLVQGIGGILTHHGISGYLSNVDLVRGMDEETARWTAFYATWWERFTGQPVTAKTLYDSAQHVAKGPFAEEDPWNGCFITGRNGRPPNGAVQLGTWLVGEERRPRGGFRISGQKDRKGTTWWTLHRLSDEQSVTEALGRGDHPDRAFTRG